MDAGEIDALREELEVTAMLRGRAYEFTTTWGLFSPRSVDEGTAMLADLMPIASDDDCLDVGCGYGPIGLVMAREAPGGRTLMVDRDFVAVRYAARNARRNGIANAGALLSNGFSEIAPDRRFDRIASNLPAKVGRELITLITVDAFAHLRPGGTLSVVTINHLRPMIRRLFEDVFGNYEKVKQGSTYTVSLARRDARR